MQTVACGPARLPRTRWSVAVIRGALFALALIIVPACGLGQPTAATPPEAAAGRAHVSDWPMWRYDAQRSGVCPQPLSEGLGLAWEQRLEAARPAWPATQQKLQFDHVAEPVSVGGRVFVPSATRGSVRAFDLASGRLLWEAFSNAPVRFAPVGSEDRVYFVSDDGYLYCVAAADGALQWRVRGGPSERWSLGNQRLVSSWPARGGPVLHRGRIYFAASIWPFMGIFIHAVAPDTGEVLWTNSGDGTNFTIQPHNTPSFASVAPQGHLAALANRLVVPGGRSTPALFDADSGKMLIFKYDKRQGGHAVAVSPAAYHVGGQSYLLDSGVPIQGPAPRFLAPGSLLATSETELTRLAVEPEMGRGTGRRGLLPMRTAQWTATAKFSLREPVAHWLLQAGDQVVGRTAAGKLLAYRLPLKPPAEPLAPIWESRVADPGIGSAIAVRGRLLTISSDGALRCFAAKSPSPSPSPKPTDRNSPPGPADTRPGALAKAALPEDPSDMLPNELTRRSNREPRPPGYTLLLGAPSSDFAQALAARLEEEPGQQLVVLESDADRVTALRQRFSTGNNLYGNRVSVLHAAPSAIQLPSYFARQVIHGGSAGPGGQAPAEWTPAQWREFLRVLRPYGGRAFVRDQPSRDHPSRDPLQQVPAGLREATAVAPEHWIISRHDDWLRVERRGALPGSADWTHQYGDASQSVVSSEQLVKAPLGVLWFGGPSHEGILPRHGHGPSPQVAGGRLVIEGADLLRATDIYTGQLLWERRLPGLGAYYDTTRHFAGAGEIGSNYVTLADAIYVVYGSQLLHLDPRTGETVRQWSTQDFAPTDKLPTDKLPTDKAASELAWGAAWVRDQVLVATVGPVAVSRDNGQWQPQRYASGSRRLVAVDRQSGRLLWTRDAAFNFRHNNVVLGSDRVYCLDALSSDKLGLLRRRGQPLPGEPTLYALDLSTGEVAWSIVPRIVGTFLNYSQTHDCLLLAGSAYRDRARDESDRGMMVLRGRDGKVLWEKPDLRHGGPCLLWNDQILTNGGGGFALELATGEPTGWGYSRAYGCNTAIGCQHLLTFRSGAAGFFDLLNDSGTGNLGGFRSSCTNNLIPAGGLLNAPDYTRTCTCAYQNQTSLALIHMPEAEFWTYGAKPRNQTRAVNLGAPGDRRAPGGSLWVEYPAVAGRSPAGHTLELAPQKQLRYFRFHSALVADGPLPWVAASGVEGVQHVRWPVDVEGKFQLKLYFLEPLAEPAAEANRSFDVRVQGKLVAQNYRPAHAAGGPRHGAVLSVPISLAASQALEIELIPQSELPPVLSGIELSPRSEAGK